MNNEQLTVADKVREKRKDVQHARQAMEKAQKKLDTLEAELRAVEEIARAINVPIDGDEANQDGQTPPKRGLSRQWKSVIAKMAAKYPASLSLDEIGELARAEGVKSEKETVRSQMHVYTGRYVERMSAGLYRATPEGAAAAEVTLGGRDGQTETAGVDETPAAA